MTHLCEKIISTLPSWRKLNGPNQLMSLQQFVYDVQDQLNPLASEEDLRCIAQQLHSTGEVRLLEPRWGVWQGPQGSFLCPVPASEGGMKLGGQVQTAQQSTIFQIHGSLI